MAMAFGCHIIAINVITFFVYGVDKLKARKSWWRISEKTLLLLAALGGSIGAWAGMRLWHHKTLHKKVPLWHPCNNHCTGCHSGIFRY